MTTKAELLGDVYNRHEFRMSDTPFTESEVLPIYTLMDEWSKEVAMNFAVYVRQNWQPTEKNMWWNEKTNLFTYSEGLYQFYLDHLKKQSNDSNSSNG